MSLGYSHYRRVKSQRFPPHLWLFDLCLLPPHPSIFLPRQSLFLGDLAHCPKKAEELLDVELFAPSAVEQTMLQACSASCTAQKYYCLSFPICCWKHHHFPPVRLERLFKIKEETMSTSVLIFIISSFFYSFFHLKISECHIRELILVFSLISNFFFPTGKQHKGPVPKT